VQFKEAIEPIRGALDTVTAMRGISFNWRYGEFPEQSFSPKRQLGLIAQEVEALCPDLVTTDEDGKKSLDYEQIVPLLLEALKEQQKVITSQEDRMRRLEGALQKLGLLD
jgi:hypothetical protein